MMRIRFLVAVLGIVSLGLGGTARAPAAAPSIAPSKTPPAGPSMDGRRHYKTCVSMTSQKPEKALNDALAWRDSGGGLPAEHCAALALVALGRYKDAAERLDGLVSDVTTGRFPMPDPDVNVEDMRLDLLAQAGNAWLLAAQADDAYRDLSEAMADTAPSAPRYIELLIDRARSLAAMGEFKAAIDDLTQAAARAPKRAEIYAFRAAAWRALSKGEQALKDAETALLFDPDNLAALLERGNLRRLAGDSDGARADWRRILDLAPNTPAAQSARTNIQRLEIGDADPAN